MRLRGWFLSLSLLTLGVIPAFGQAESKAEAYARKIREYTTDPRYLSELVDHLPESTAVRSPLDYFGDIVGAPGRLHYVDEIYGYLTELSRTSPRVMQREIGSTEEGRKMIEFIVADEATLREIDKYREYLNRLADPRATNVAEKDEILSQAKPVYYITGALHSPETGAPEMLMELAFRLAVEDSPLIRNIRENVITVIVPVAEPDGRDRMVDTYNYRKAHNDVGPPLVYWGHYVAHDNNRDGFGLALDLTRNILKAFLYWKPTVGHDLHESVPYLYISTGTGPYNEYLDTITVNEWHSLAHEETTALAGWGMPGVWTHGFYTGWAGNYLLWIPNNRNSIGRFYETFGNSIPETKERKLPKRSTSKQWYRTNPPLEKTLWSFRNNINYQETALLTALNYVAENGLRFLQDFYRKSRNAVDRGRSEAPYAYVIPTDQSRPIATADLVNLLRLQGLEVHRLADPFTPSSKQEEDEKPGAKDDGKESEKESEPAVKPGTFETGSYVVRLDQPYRTLARILLDRQDFPTDAQPPYDDTGWTLPYLRGVETVKVEDPAILDAEMDLVQDDARVEGRLEDSARPVFAINDNTDDAFAVLRFRLPDVRFEAAEAAFEADGHSYRSGSYLIRAEGNPTDLSTRLRDAATDLGLEVRGLEAVPEGLAVHEVGVPRVALVHTWVATPQNAGWWRLAFDRIGIPYTYLSEQDLADQDLSRFDVILFPNTYAGTDRLINGTTSSGAPIPWKRTELTPSLGRIDETDDVRRGMGYAGVEHLSKFVRDGGVLIVEGGSCAFAIDTALVRRVRIQQPRDLLVRGSVLKSVVHDAKSPIVYGYGEDLAVHFSQSPVFRVDEGVGGFSAPDWLKDQVWAAEVPRTVLSFAKKDLLMSGMLRGEKALADKPAVLDVPVGQGHIVMFAIHPFWRWETHASHALVFNTILHWNHLRVGWPTRPEEDEQDDDDAGLGFEGSE